MNPAQVIAPQIASKSPETVMILASVMVAMLIGSVSAVGNGHEELGSSVEIQMSE